MNIKYKKPVQRTRCLKSSINAKHIRYLANMYIYTHCYSKVEKDSNPNLYARK